MTCAHLRTGCTARAPSGSPAISNKVMSEEHDDQDRTDAEGFLQRCVAFDLEVGKKDNRIHLLGAVRRQGHTERCHTHDKGAFTPAAAQAFEHFAQGADFLLGHNIIHFDLQHLRDAAPDLTLLQRPAIDTLWLNPLAYPRNPYHRLVKHDQEGRLISGQRNDPVADSRTAMGVFVDQFGMLRRAAPELLTAWHWLSTRTAHGFLQPTGFDALFTAIRRHPLPSDADARAAVLACIQDKGCPRHTDELLSDLIGPAAARSASTVPHTPLGLLASLRKRIFSSGTSRNDTQDKAAQTSAHDIRGHHHDHWGLAYALAWLSVAGANSVIPPWVLKQFPLARQIIRQLRETSCERPDCPWCSERHDAVKELRRLFPAIPGFRPEPRDEKSGKPLQQAIVEGAMHEEHVLGILPTGTGKSLCYQVPCLSRFEKTGALTVVISPLVALMEDQVKGLLDKGHHCAAAINGLLSMPERSEVLERIRLGDVGILVIAPEQLRNRTVRNVLKQREIGAWVFDEAHCVSKWGHDFRPDYRYASRYIRERAGNEPIPPILCLTATAKPDVVSDMTAHFRDRTGVALAVFNGGAERRNLSYEVIPTTPERKFDQIHDLIQQRLLLKVGRSTQRTGTGSITPDAKSAKDDENTRGETHGSEEQDTSGVIIYCASRRKTEEIAGFLKDRGLEAGYFHAGLKPDAKKETQQHFIDGRLRAMAATNAFGMGIDKPDVRLVIHADIPGSLENYLQEAGRAGRDGKPAECVLLYVPDDVERQLGMSARSRLSQRDIQIVLSAVRKLAKRSSKNRNISPDEGSEVIATSGEILLEDAQGEFERDDATDDTKVRTALAWLEEAHLLTRNENLVTVFPSSLKVGSLEECRQKLESDELLGKQKLYNEYKQQLLAILGALFNADADTGISTDALMAASGLEPQKIRKAMQDLEALGLVSDDTALTAFVHASNTDHSRTRLRCIRTLEETIILALKHQAPDMAQGDVWTLDLRLLTQHVRDVLSGAGHEQLESSMPKENVRAAEAGSETRDDPLMRHVQPLVMHRILRSMTLDRPPKQAHGNIGLRRLDIDRYELKLHARSWQALEKAAELRATIASLLLEHLLSTLPPGTRIKDALAETTMGALRDAMLQDIEIRSRAEQHDSIAREKGGKAGSGPDESGAGRFLARGLLWMHEQEVIRLNKGTALFRPAMTLRLAPGQGKFNKQQYAPLKDHYQAQVEQIHVMSEYARRGMPSTNTRHIDPMHEANELVKDYFGIPFDTFMRKWLPNLPRGRQMTEDSWRRIIDDLGNDNQQRIVMVDGDRPANQLVLAGPGSGKTRTLVHRIAYLVRGRRERPESILAIAYNRHAAAEIRKRLRALIGADARGVMVMTIHAMAMRLTGDSLANRKPASDGKEKQEDIFRAIIRRATALLTGSAPDSAVPMTEPVGDAMVDEVDETRERLLAGFRWILIDEYQDIEQCQYELISALAGRTLKPADDDDGSEDRRLNMFAVGDDDQNIYAFNGASVTFIRNFREDYLGSGEEPAYLVENYRSTRHIIDAANVVIAPAANRMKHAHPVRIDTRRRDDPPGGDMSRDDPVAGGRVQVLRLRQTPVPSGNDWTLQQATIVMEEFRRLQGLSTDWDWSSCAVIAREWKYLAAIRTWCELHDIPVQSALDGKLPFWWLRETQQLVAMLREHAIQRVSEQSLRAFVQALPATPWRDILLTAVEEYSLEMGSLTLSANTIIEWLAEWTHEARQKQQGLLLVSAHRTKGLEFDHVAILDGGWEPGRQTAARQPNALPDPDETRRLFYVAMTRARKTLMMVQAAASHPFACALEDSPAATVRDIEPSALIAGMSRHYQLASMKDIDLGFAGRRHATDPVHAHIKQLKTGDALKLCSDEQGNWKLLDTAGHLVGRMAKSWKPLPGHQVSACTVHAIVARLKQQTDEPYINLCKVDAWEVVVPEVVWTPGSQAHAGPSASPSRPGLSQHPLRRPTLTPAATRNR